MFPVIADCAIWRLPPAVTVPVTWNLVVLLHMFRKDTGRLPEREIEIARKRWSDFKERMDAERRVPPRAAGHDAP